MYCSLQQIDNFRFQKFSGNFSCELLYKKTNFIFLEGLSDIGYGILGVETEFNYGIGGVFIEQTTLLDNFLHVKQLTIILLESRQ